MWPNISVVLYIKYMHVQLFIATISIVHIPTLQTGYLYSRWGNPTVDAAADTIARLEGAVGSLLFSSGMAAIVTSMLTFLQTGDHIVSLRSVT